MGIIDIIKYEGDNNTFVWKHPAEDFSTLSQLIVHESQEAILFRDGQALDLFGPGRYTLHSQNIPLLRKIINIPFNGQSPFHCEVYFVNKVMPLDMKWGTNSQIIAQDPKFNILLHAGANGGMGIQIENSRIFLEKFVGTTKTFGKEELIDYFRELICTRVKTYLTSIMTKVSFVTVNAKLNEMSKAMHDTLLMEMQEFGVRVIKFFVSAIQLDKEDYEKIQTALADASVMGIGAVAEKGKMETLGYTWAERETADILKAYASNEGSQNNVGSTIAQMPMAFAFGQMLKQNSEPMLKNLFSSLSPNTSDVNAREFCSRCGRLLEVDAKFCSACGKQIITDGLCTCVNCGRILKKDDCFCPQCGTKNETNGVN